MVDPTQIQLSFLSLNSPEKAPPVPKTACSLLRILSEKNHAGAASKVCIRAFLNRKKLQIRGF